MSEQTAEVEPVVAEVAIQEPASINTAISDQMPEFSELERIRLAVEKGEEIEVKSEEAKPAPSEDEAKEKPKAKAEGEVDVKAEEPESDIEKLKRELRARDGKYGSEKQKLMKQIEELNARLETAAVEPKKEQAKTVVSAEPQDSDLEDAYGSDFKEFMSRDYAVRLWKASQKQMLGREQEIMSKVDKFVESKLGNVKAQTALERAISEIEKTVPGVRDIDSAADVNGFGEYLDGEYADTGIPRREIVERAIASIQSGATGAEYAKSKKSMEKIFREFSQGETVASEPQEQAPQKARPDPKQYVMPSTSRSDKGVQSNAHMTMEQVEEAFKKAEKGGNVDKVMAEIFKKAANGEIVG